MRSFKKKNRAEWKKLISEQQSSSLNVREFCKQHGLQEARFYSWRKTLGKTAAQELAESAPLHFLPVKVKASPEEHLLAPAVGNNRIDIFLGNGNVVRISGGMSEDQLVSLLSRLGEPAC